jgi:cyclic dehypoxanthinyl futalosine synthase
MKPEGANGFLAFIPWTFQDVDTLLTKIRGVHNLTTTEEYIRMIAISRIMLPNIKNIQASWLTVGKATLIRVFRKPSKKLDLNLN